MLTCRVEKRRFAKPVSLEMPTFRPVTSLVSFPELVVPTFVLMFLQN